MWPHRQRQNDATVSSEPDEVLCCAAFFDVRHAIWIVQRVCDSPPAILIEVDGWSAVEGWRRAWIETFRDDQVVPRGRRQDPPSLPVEDGAGDLGVPRSEPGFQFLFEDLAILANDPDGSVLEVDLPVLVPVSREHKRFVHATRLGVELRRGLAVDLNTYETRA